MPPHPKKSKLNGTSANDTASSAAAAGVAADRIADQPNSNADDGIVDSLLDDDSENKDPTINGMSNSLTATILGFLGYKDIMRSRICCKKLRDAARSTIVPWAEYDKSSYSFSLETQFCVNSVKKHKAMVALTTALPNLQQIRLSSIGHGHKYCEGKDPDEEEAASTADWTTHEIQMISKFTKLRSLSMYATPLNGRYPVLFNFPLLQILKIQYCGNLKWDLNALTKLRCLKELNVDTCDSLTGNIKSLRVLRATLENVYIHIRNCEIEGDFMDLADFPRLTFLNLTNCSLITGDMREIGENDFPMLESLHLGEGVIGSNCHKFQHISDVASVAEAVHRLKQRNPPQNVGYVFWSLSQDSNECYTSNGKAGHPPPPFSIDFVRAGSRVGWRWKATHYNHGCKSRVTNSCEINWLDPEPGRESNDYDVYIRELQSIQEDVFCFEGYHQPPTEEEYKRVCEEYYDI
eukprot:scaffold2120_cov150-Skeletonema_dohrnii-CCMP3373.AAC.4